MFRDDLIGQYREKLAAAKGTLDAFEKRNMRFLASGVDMTEEGKAAIRYAISNLEKVVAYLEGRVDA